MQETWYVLENGASADPNEVAPDASGRLVHTSGVPVAVGPHGPRSRGVDPVAERAKAVSAGTISVDDARASQGLPAVGAKDMTPEKPRRGYATREIKAG